MLHVADPLPLLRQSVRLARPRAATAVGTPTPVPSPRATQSLAAQGRTESPARRSPRGIKTGVAARPVARILFRILFAGLLLMTHAGRAGRAGGRIFQRQSLFPTPLSPAMALLAAALPSLLAGPVLLLRFPLRPPPRRLPTRLTAIVPSSAARPKSTPAPLQQAGPPTRATEGSLHSLSMRIMLEWAHGRSRLPEAQASDGRCILSSEALLSIVCAARPGPPQSLPPLYFCFCTTSPLIQPHSGPVPRPSTHDHIPRPPRPYWLKLDDRRHS